MSKKVRKKKIDTLVDATVKSIPTKPVPVPEMPLKEEPTVIVEEAPKDKALITWTNMSGKTASITVDKHGLEHEIKKILYQAKSFSVQNIQ